MSLLEGQNLCSSRTFGGKERGWEMGDDSEHQSGHATNVAEHNAYLSTLATKGAHDLHLRRGALDRRRPVVTPKRVGRCLVPDERRRGIVPSLVESAFNVGRCCSSDPVHISVPVKSARAVAGLDLSLRVGGVVGWRVICRGVEVMSEPGKWEERRKTRSLTHICHRQCPWTQSRR